jgi:transposase-like protein
MATSVLSAPHFHNEAAAFEYVESKLWPNGPVCPHCGQQDRVGRLTGKTTRLGLCKCYSCRKPFTVRMGTIFESSHLPLHLWLQVIHLMCASKKGISSRQIQRMLQCSMKTAWFLSHRIREAMTARDLEPFGSQGGAVEIDETYIGRKPGVDVATGYPHHKYAVMTLVDRDSGKAYSEVITKFDAATVGGVLDYAVSAKARMNTDQAPLYALFGHHFASHGAVNHSKDEWTRYEAGHLITTNTVEGYFSVFKRGMVGVYQHCSGNHLHRYLAEFDFRYSNRIKLGVDDTERATRALKGVVGKRLTYETTCGQAEA